MSIHGQPEEQEPAQPESPAPSSGAGHASGSGVPRDPSGDYGQPSAAAGYPSQPGQHGEHGQDAHPGQAGQPAPYGQAGEPGQPSPYGHLGGGHASPSGQPGQPGQYGPPGQYGQAGEHGQPGNTPPSGYAAGVGGYSLAGESGGYRNHGGYGGYGVPGQPGGPGYAGPGYGTPGGPPPKRRSRRLVAGIMAAGIAFAGGAGAAVWAVGVPGTSVGGALDHKVLSTSSIVQMTDPAVVDVVSTLGGQGAESAGTGIVLTSNGEVLTNNHVIDGATAIRVTDVGNGETYPAKVVGYDPTHDIAVLKLTGASGLKTATVGDSSGVGVGQKVVAVGNAGGKGGLPSVATGSVTGLGASITAVDEGSGSSERLTGMIKTNAGIQAGDSGGPLLNTSGQVIGMNTAASTGMTEASTGTAQAEQAFSIPISRAIATAAKIQAGQGSSTIHIGSTAFVGVQIAGNTGQGASGGSATSGAAVAGVVQGGPAAAAGLQAGDTIVSVNGKAVTSPSSLRNNLVIYHPGDHVTVKWVSQDGQTHSAQLTLASGPAA
ncbi:MAG: trypsin-like peptidase domain-containing protein [Streptosporangiaceae bacterium]